MLPKKDFEININVWKCSINDNKKNKIQKNKQTLEKSHNEQNWLIWFRGDYHENNFFLNQFWLIQN